VIAPGDTAPDFTLPDQEGRPVTLSELRGQKVVVYFYPKADTPGSEDSSPDRLRWSRPVARSPVVELP
jgi:peroxiredoxin Q/BCP